MRFMQKFQGYWGDFVLSGTTKELRQHKQALLKALHAKERRREGLPHLYGFPFYKWAREFFESKNKNCFLCAANQISKSSTMIRKCIHWATEDSLWDELWPTKPKQFWYLYPDKNVATSEFENKWVKEFLPKDEFKDDPKYGWKAYRQSNRKIDYIEFKSGVTVYFKTYAQDPSSLQTSTVHAIFCDEELPYMLYDELTRRRSAAAIRGYFSMVFTATLGQEFWRLTIEEKGKHELFKDALKIQVSMFDCLEYEDGSPSPWTKEIIEEEIKSCSSEAEVQRRIMGRFVVDENRVYEGFSRSRNVKPKHHLPKDWLVYSGVDIGSGGAKNHPAAITFVGVKPDFTQGRVFLGWRGDGIETTAGDVLNQYRMMRGNMRPILQCYDYESKDFHTIASRMGEAFLAADKSKDIGIGMLNTLFKHSMLSIYIDEENEDDELMKLVHEIENLQKTNTKQHGGDDFCFSGGTQVYTSNGIKSIRDIKVGDYVLTRFGFQKVLQKSERIAKTYLYKTSYRDIRCTPNHKFFDGKNFKPIQDFELNDRFLNLSVWGYLKCLINLNLSSLMELRFEDAHNLKKGILGYIIGHLVTIEKKASDHFIRKFGNRKMAIFLKGMLFTIKTMIRLIIALKILNVLIVVIIKAYMRKSVLKILSLLRNKICILTGYVNKLKHGIVVKKVSNGIDRMEKRLGKTESLLIKFVYCVTRHIKRLKVQIQNFVRIAVNPNIEGLKVWITKKNYVRFVGGDSLSTGIVKPKHAAKNVLSYPESELSEKVYNLTVENHHEYYANGLLVSNCDSLRYAVTRIPWDFSQIDISGAKAKTIKEDNITNERERYYKGLDKPKDNFDLVEAEFDFANEAYEYYGFD